MFVVPQLPGSARVLGPLESWREGLAQAQVDLDTREPDLVVAPASLAAEGVALRPRSLVLEGRPRRGTLRGYAARPLLALPDRDAPEMLLPAGVRAPVRYALDGGAGGRRARLTRPLLERGLIPPPFSPTVVAARDPGPPALVRVAAGFRPEVAGSSWLPVLGRWGDPFSRAVLLLFPAGSTVPRWALKFARVPGNGRPFDLDEQGLGLAAAAGGSVAAHAPRLLGRFTAGPLEASLETAVVGRRLLIVLAETGRREQKLTEVERVAGWIETVARGTHAAPAPLDAQRRRLAEEAGLFEAVSAVPSGFEHGDLWPDNVVVDRGTFGVLDWESARAHGFPLWDLFYFLTAALAFVDGTASEAEQDEHFVRLWRGELPSSTVLFEWTRRFVDAAGIPPDAVGALATLRVLWLAHEDARHAEKTAAAGAGGGTPVSVRQAALWLADPQLGPGWDRWRR
jgi:hypothetical protein